MIRKWLTVFGEKLGIKSMVSLIVLIATAFPDWMGRFQSWHEWLAEAVTKPWFGLISRLIIIAVGVVVIVSDVREHLKRGKHNIVATQFEYGPLLYQEEHGYFISRVEPPRSMRSIVLDVVNLAHPKNKVLAAGKVRAQLTYSLTGNSPQIVSPGTWVGEFFSSVEISPGDSRQLIIGLCCGPDDWRTVVNRRGNSGEAVSVSFNQNIYMGEGTVTVDLVSCETGGVIRQFELGWKWPHQYSPTISHIKRLL